MSVSFQNYKGKVKILSTNEEKLFVLAEVCCKASFKDTLPTSISSGFPELESTLNTHHLKKKKIPTRTPSNNIYLNKWYSPPIKWSLSQMFC